MGIGHRRYWISFFICGSILCFAPLFSQAQFNCDPPPTADCESAIPGFGDSRLVLNNVPSGQSFQNIDVPFTTGKDYYAGRIITGGTTLSVKVDPLTAACKWGLKMTVDNDIDGMSAAVATEWFQATAYGIGNSGINPPISELEVKVYNICNTPIANGVFRNFTNHLDQLLIIDGTAMLQAAGTCTGNVNGPGSFQTNFAEYTFYVDYKIKFASGSEFSYNPGLYQLRIHFCLVENN